MSQRELKTDLESLLVLINEQIDEVYREARGAKVEPTSMKNTDGTFVLVPLLVAKAQVAAALAVMHPRANVTNIINPVGKKW